MRKITILLAGMLLPLVFISAEIKGFDWDNWLKKDRTLIITQSREYFDIKQGKTKIKKTTWVLDLQKIDRKKGTFYGIMQGDRNVKVKGFFNTLKYDKYPRSQLVMVGLDDHLVFVASPDGDTLYGDMYDRSTTAFVKMTSEEADGY